MSAESDQRFVHLEQVLRDYDRDKASRAKRFFEKDRVKRIDWSDTGFSARVQDEDMFVNRWSWKNQRWENACTCDGRGWCEHGYAVGLLALSARVPGALLDLLPEQFVPAVPVAPVSPRAVSAKARATEEFGLPEFEAKLAAAHGRKLTVNDRRLSGALASTFTRWGRAGGPTIYELDQFAAPSVTPREPLNPVLVQAALQHAEAADNLLEFWQRVALALRHTGRPLAPELEALVDKPRLDRELARLQHERAVSEWRTKLRALEPTAPVEGSTGGPRGLRVLVTTRRLIWQAPTPTGGWVEIPNDDVVALTSATRDPATDRTAAWNAKALLLLEIFTEATRTLGKRYLTLREPIVRQAIARAMVHPELGDAVLDAQGQPFARSNVALVWKLTPDPDQPAYLRVALARADGEPVPEGVIHLAGPPHVYLAENVVWPGPPPLHERPDAGWQISVPTEAVRTPEVLRALVKSGASLPEEIASEVEHVALHPHLRAWLAENTLGREEVRVAFSACDPGGERRLARNTQGWTEKFRGAKPPSRERAVIFDHRGMQTALAHFESLRFEWDPSAGAWARTVSTNTPEEIATWLSGFPIETEFDLSPELIALREDPISAAFDFRIIEDPNSRDWFDVQLAVKASDHTLTKEEIALLMQAQGRWVRLEGRGWRRLNLAAKPGQAERLKELGLSEGSALQGKQRFHALQLAAAGVEQLLAGEQWKRVQDRAHAVAVEEAPPLPAGLRAELRPYQTEGFHFLAFLARNSFGGILADDMGLGKTVQALAWLLWLAGNATAEKPLRALVVCPKSVTTNWERETARFAPELSVAIFDPKQRGKLPAVNLLVANYAQLRSSEDVFLSAQWSAVILDEGQNIKNPDSQTAGIARKLRAPQRLVLTGTPIENRALDLWSLFAFAMPGLLGGQTQFRRTYDDKKDPEARHRLARRVRHFLLRRTKAQVAPDLPPRIEEDVLCELEGEQATLYQAELKRARQLVLGMQTDAEFERSRFNVLHSLLRLRQICCHPALLGGELTKAPSAKVEAFFDQLEPILEEGHKVLVFSQFVTMLELLRTELVKHDIKHLMLTGQTENRQELVDKFQADPEIPVFLLSLKAAGSGLNLTAASYVVLFDPWWNPAVEAQAIDRTHRIGQSNQVIAYRLIAKGTVEEKIRLLQQEKAALAKAIVQEESLASVLDLESLRYVLS